MSTLTRLQAPTPDPWWIAWQRALVFRDGGREAPYVDCFGFVRLALMAECGIALPAWPELTLDTLTAGDTSLLSPGFTQGFTPVQTGLEQGFDVAVIRRPLPVNNRLVQGWWHMGLVTRPGFIIHMHPAQGMVEEPFRDTALALASATLKPRDVKLLRHDSLVSTAAAVEACA